MKPYKNKEELGGMLRLARLYAKLTQAQVATRMKTKQPSIARAEKCGTYSINFAERFARACGYELRFNHITMESDIESFNGFTSQ